MLKDFFTKRGIKNLLDKVRVGGATVKSHLDANKKNSIESFFGLFKRVVMAGTDIDIAIAEATKLAKTRKRQTLNTLKNILAAVRGQGRAVMAMGKKGIWANSSVLDGNTTEVCRNHVGMTWRLPYSEIPNKPPRVPPAHPCRSFLIFRQDGFDYVDERPFMDQFNASEDVQLDLLKPTRFEAFKKGELKINSFAQFERVVLTNLVELGLLVGAISATETPSETGDE